MSASENAAQALLRAPINYTYKYSDYKRYYIRGIGNVSLL